MDRELATDEFNRQVRELLDRFEPHLSFTPEGIAGVMTGHRRTHVRVHEIARFQQFW